MDALFAIRPFVDFGPTRLDPAPGPPALHRVHGRRPGALRGRVRQSCPKRPGVYGMVDPRGQLIYVGKAKSLRARLLSYFRPRSRHEKAGRILRCTRRVVWEHTPSEFAALLRELELIQRWHPHFNVHGQPRRRRPVYICLGRRPAPYLFLSSRPAPGLLTFGPLYAARRVAEAVRRLNDLFQLRDCPRSQPMVFSEQSELFPIVRTAGCLRYEIGTCLGPCAAACSRSAYRERVHEARRFLEGKDRSALVRFEREMAAASAATQFERAAALRDKVEALRWLDSRLDRLRQARQRHSFVYPVRGHDGRDLWYLIHHGRIVAVVPSPRDAVTRARAAEAVDAVFFARTSWQVPAEQIDGVLLVTAWFQRRPEERRRTISPANALAVVLASA
ncbi:MAG TPA: GIY-YIG nuclease family protein [Gemmataceae bacterium]|nr:GIY-YIG nuclease family protein [Gemmataceae bacterium]